MVKSVEILCSSSNGLVVKKDKEKDAEKDTSVLKKQDVSSSSVQEEAYDQELVDMLYRMEQEEQNPPFTLSFADSENNKKKLDEFYLASKKGMLKMLVRSAQLRSPHQYTGTSWKALVKQMREAMNISGKKNPNIESLNKALNLMRRGLSGLRYNAPKPEYKNLKNPLPMAKLELKNDASRFDKSENQPNPFNVSSLSSDIANATLKVMAGTNLDVSCLSQSEITTNAMSSETINLRA